MKYRLRNLIPIAVGISGAILMGTLYFGIVSWAESPQHALETFRENYPLVIPLMVGFGIQTALYSILKLRLFIPVTSPGLSGPMMGVGGSTSLVAMIACCAHHAVDVLPLLGLSIAATFLAKYQTVFMLISLGMNIIGISVMLSILFRERKTILNQYAITETLS